jgi:hypothetical protein
MSIKRNHSKIINQINACVFDAVQPGLHLLLGGVRRDRYSFADRSKSRREGEAFMPIEA